MPLQIRRGTEAERQAMTIPLAVGEPLYVTDTGSIWVGDGVSPGGVQVTGLTLEDSVDAVAAALTAGINQNITFVYGTAQDQANRIDAILDLSTVDGVISADGFKGSVLADDSGVIVNSTNRNISANDISANDISVNNLTLSGDILTTGAIVADLQGSVIADDSTVLIDSIDGTVNLLGTINADVVPNLDGSIDLGTNAVRFRNLFLRSGGLYLDNALITGSPFGSVDLPSGSTMGGVPLSTDIPIIGDLNVNIIGDDSSVIVDVSTQSFNGNLFGNVTGDVRGSVFGDDSTILVDGTESALRTANLTFRDFSIFSDTTRLFLGDVNNKLSVDIYSEGDAWLNLYGSYDPISQDGPWIEQRVSRNTMGSPATVVDTDVLSGMMIFGYDGSDYSRAVTLAARVSGTVATDIVPAEFLAICQTDTLGVSNIMSFKGNQGILTAPTIKPGVYADATARDAFLTSPEEGMMIFNQALQKFQGYVTDTGLAGGGPSNATPGWIDLN